MMVHHMKLLKSYGEFPCVQECVLGSDEVRVGYFQVCWSGWFDSFEFCVVFQGGFLSVGSLVSI